jgi:2-succinyl-6-hydroxy-2,4-cyclohexadiene-1-carboxylate synthase
VAPWRFTPEAVAAEIWRYAPHEPLDLVGYSMGGRLALGFALTYPERVRRLVLESASPGLETDEERTARRAADEELAKQLEGEGVEAFVDRWEAQPLFASQSALPAEVRTAHRARRLRNDPRSLAAALRGLGTGVLPSYWRALEACEVPTLLLTGEVDMKFVDIAGRMQDRMRNARLVVVPGAGHAVHLERPQAWVEAVVGFLA